MRDRSTFYYRALAVLLALLGLAPSMWTGLTSGDWTVARLTVIDPLAITALCMAAAFLFPEAVRAAQRHSAGLLHRIPRAALVGLVVAIIVAAAMTVSRLAYNGQPAITDEHTQAFQGRILLAGRLAAEPEAFPEFFETPQTVRRFGRWFSEYPILPGALATLDAAGVGSLTNPVLLAIAAIAIYGFAKRVWGESTARIALILVAVSPFASFMAATRMSHVPALTLASLALYSLARWDLSGSWPWATATGASLGAIVLVRPYDALLIALPILLFQLAMIVRSRQRMSSMPVTALATLAVAGIQLWVNARTTGHPFLFGYDALNGASHRPGFHTDPLGFPFTPADGIDHVVRYLSRLNTALFESAVPALAFICAAMWLTRPGKWDWLLVALIFTVLAGYALYWFDGNFMGPRFLFVLLGPFTILVARFMTAAAERAKGNRIAAGATLILPVCLGLACVPASLGDRATGISLRIDAMRRKPIAMSPDPSADVERAGISNAVVFIREPLHARLTARLRALGMAPFDAERTVSDLDACALLDALARADARTNVPAAERLRTVFDEARQTERPRPVKGLVGAAALSLANGVPANAPCWREIDGDRAGVEAFERFLAHSTIDSAGRLGGPVVFARYLGARDTMLRSDARFASRSWYLYRRAPNARTGQFVPYAPR